MLRTRRPQVRGPVSPPVLTSGKTPLPEARTRPDRPGYSPLVDLPEPAPLPPARSPRILLVESDLSVARVLASFLDPFEVEIATSFADALVRIAAAPVLAAVICDFDLDDLDNIDGHGLYLLACDRFPELRGRFIFMTGASSPPPGLDESAALPVLCRPFDPDLLLATLHKLLLRHPPRAEV